MTISTCGMEQNRSNVLSYGRRVPAPHSQGARRLPEPPRARSSPLFFERAQVGHHIIHLFCRQAVHRLHFASAPGDDLFQFVIGFRLDFLGPQRAELDLHYLGQAGIAVPINAMAGSARLVVNLLAVLRRSCRRCREQSCKNTAENYRYHHWFPPKLAPQFKCRKVGPAAQLDLQATPFRLSSSRMASHKPAIVIPIATKESARPLR